MKAKATHQGHCQVCGHKQKLPGGKLSQHGYTVRCGFFSGVCFGSINLPFEQDISLERAIKEATAQGKRLRQRAADTVASIDPSNVTYNAYEDWRRYGIDKRSCYKRVDGKLEVRKSLLGQDEVWFVATLYNGKTYEHNLVNTCGCHSLAKAVTTLNASKAWAISQTAQQAEDYVKWQQFRIKGWKPSPLLPIGK